MTLRSLRAAPALILMAAPLTPQAEGFSASLDEGLSYQSPQGNLKLRLGGRLHLDGAIFNEDKAPLEDDLIVRRARLSLRADLYRDWRLSMEYDLADEEERYRSLWLRYSGYENRRITAGQFQEPFGLEEATSSNATLFMERSLANTLVPGANVGFGMERWGGNWSASGGLFWESYIEDADPFASRAGNGVTGRLTAAPLQSGEQVLHLGVSASWRLPEDDNRIRFRARPESEVTDVRLIDTGSIRHVDDYLTYGVEAAAMTGPFMLQGEYVAATVHRTGGRGAEEFSGGYIAASYLLGGRQRSYSASSGSFSGVKIESGASAWELALRRSFLDLNGSSSGGGAQVNVTWGVNWYPHENVRMMFNYITVDTDETAGNDDPSILQARLQLAI